MSERKLQNSERKAERLVRKEEKRLVAKANKKRRDARIWALLLAPATIIFLLFVVWPIIYNIYLSFYEWNMVSPNKTFVGADNYLNLLSDKSFLKSLGNTGWYVLILMVTCFAFPYFLSYVMVHLIDKGQETYRSILFFPSLVSLAVGSAIAFFMFNYVAGPVNSILKVFGINGPNWINTGGYVLLVLALVATWKTFGYNLIIFLAAVLEVPSELIEAAKLENATKATIFWKIVLPLTSSTAFYVFVVTFSYALSYLFTPISIITQGGPNDKSTNLVYQIYQYAFLNFQSGRAAATSIVTLLIVVLIVILYQALEKRVHYEN